MSFSGRDWASLLADAAEVFTIVAGVDEHITKQTFVEAYSKGQATDFDNRTDMPISEEIFNEMDIDHSGDVPFDEWMKFIRRTHVKEGDKGDAWLRDFLNILMKDCALEEHPLAYSTTYQGIQNKVNDIGESKTGPDHMPNPADTE